MNIQASLKVLPKGDDRVETYKLVDEALLLITKSNLTFEIGTSETTVEGDYDDVMALVSRIFHLYEEKNVEFSFILITEYNLDNFYIENKHGNINEILKK